MVNMSGSKTLKGLKWINQRAMNLENSEKKATFAAWNWGVNPRFLMPDDEATIPHGMQGFGKRTSNTF